MKTDATLSRLLEAAGGKDASISRLTPSSVTLTDTTTTDVITAQGGGYRTYLTGFQAVNSGAAVEIVTIANGSKSYVGTMEANGGVFTMEIPVPIQGSLNTAWTATLSSAATSVYVTATGFKVYEA